MSSSADPRARVGVSLVLYRSPLRPLRMTLAALSQQSLPLHRLRVHVNDAQPAYVANVRDELRRAGLAEVAVLVPDTANSGFALAHDVGVDELLRAGCAAVLVLNPDVQLAPDALERLVDFANAQPGGRCLIGPTLLRADPSTMQPDGTVDTLGIRWTRDGRHFDVRHGEPAVGLPTGPVRVRGISGACLLVPRAAHELLVERTGELFDRHFVAYREDAELALRAELIGLPMWVLADARGHHVRNVRGSQRSNPHANLLGVQNRFLIALKHGSHRPGGRSAALLRDVVVIAAVLLRERSSLPGLRSAWALRHEMRRRRRALYRDPPRSPPA